MRDWLFISDLHLDPECPEIIHLFERFVDEIAIHADRLYILGDFLEYWLGDDDKAAGLDAAFKSLKKLSDSGTDVFFMAGNRDFLVGETLAQKCGFKIIDEPYIETIHGQAALLMHGDTLCTDDVAYQSFRAVVRNKKWQDEVLSKSLEERQQLAQSMRTQSKQANTEKTEYIMDVNQDAVLACMQQHSVNLLIHGHTHRKAIHHFEINQQPATRIVLGDWHEQGCYLRINEKSEPELFSFK
jgi:UDP-2,3-diacylglucosamine hydrolase